MDIFDTCLNLDPPNPNPNPTTNTNTPDTTDFLDSSNNIIETHIEDGYKDGYKDGLISGKQDGHQVGLKHGFESGEEIGFYRGLVNVWTVVTRVEPKYFSSRVKKTVEQLDELIKEYPFVDPEDENKDVIVDKIRLKFKVVCATLGVKLEYKGYPKIFDAQDY